MLLRPQLFDPNTPGQLKLLGDVHRRGAWQVTDEEIWTGIGNVRLDMTNADVPTGKTQIRVFNFVGDVGVWVSSTAFVTDARVLGQKRDYFLTSFELSSDNYETAQGCSVLTQNAQAPVPGAAYAAVCHFQERFSPPRRPRNGG